MSGAHNASRATTAAVLALLALQLAWNGFGLWPSASVGVLVLLGAPLVVVALMQLAGLRSARFWAGVLALLTFCHGVTEAWTIPTARFPAGIEVLLSVFAVLAASWNGLQARFRKGRPAPPPV